MTRWVAIGFLSLVAGASLVTGPVLGRRAETQDRNHVGEAPSGAFPLGTDDLGRDRMVRLLEGTRVSLALAPAAALLSTILAGLIGGVAGLTGGRTDRVILAAIDV